jgi:Osmosensitive K+ channel histidine kinase
MVRQNIGICTRRPYDLSMTRAYVDDVSAERLASLQEQNLEFSRLVAELRNEAALRTQFLSNISHDLRTP